MGTLKSNTSKTKKIHDADLTVVTGGFSLSACGFGYCVSVGSDGVSVGENRGPSAGAQVYDAAMKGMRSVK